MHVQHDRRIGAAARGEGKQKAREIKRERERERYVVEQQDVLEPICQLDGHCDLP
jgi:hypothetical protein